MKTMMLTGLALAALAGGAIAAPGSASKPASATAKTALICPMTGTKIASAARAYAHETYKGKTYYFCCPECKPAFDKNPAKVIASAAKGKYRPM